MGYLYKIESSDFLNGNSHFLPRTFIIRLKTAQKKRGIIWVVFLRYRITRENMVGIHVKIQENNILSEKKRIRFFSYKPKIFQSKSKYNFIK